MKQITKEIITAKIQYEACDGTIFDDAEECKKYENSAKLVLYSRLIPHIIIRNDEYSIFNAGSEEYEYIVIKADSEIIKQNILQYHKLVYPNRNNDDEKLQKAIENCEKYLVFGIGCSYDNYDGFWYYGTVDEIINNISNKLKGESTSK